jgi:hypothetical protein
MARDARALPRWGVPILLAGDGAVAALAPLAVWAPSSFNGAEAAGFL